MFSKYIKKKNEKLNDLNRKLNKSKDESIIFNKQKVEGLQKWLMIASQKKIPSDKNKMKS